MSSPPALSCTGSGRVGSLASSTLAVPSSSICSSMASACAKSFHGFPDAPTTFPDPCAGHLLCSHTCMFPLLAHMSSRTRTVCLVSCRYQGQVSAALVLGGVDHTGPHLYSIAPHGSSDKIPYVTMGVSRRRQLVVVSSSFVFAVAPFWPCYGCGYMCC